MRKILQVSIAGWIAFCVACDNPTESKYSPYEQHPIAWPSLAKSPWPIYHGSPLVNGLSFDSGPTKGQIVWTYQPECPPQGTGLVLDSVGNIYTGLANGNLISIKPDGQLNWEIKLMEGSYPEGVCCPMVLKTGKLAVAEKDTFYVINSSGSIERKIGIPEEIQSGSFQIDKTGNFYLILSDGTLLSLAQDLTVRWQIIAPDDVFGGWGSGHVIAFFPDGNNLLVPSGRKIYKISVSGIIIWQAEYQMITPPLVDCNGNVYFYSVSDTAIIALNRDGNLIWKMNIPNENIQCYSRSTISRDGWIVFAASNLLWISPDGKNKISIKYLPLDHFYMNSELVCERSGIVYSSVARYGFYASSIDNPMIWKMEDDVWPCVAPAIGNGRLYFSSWYLGGKIYAME